MRRTWPGALLICGLAALCRAEPIPEPSAAERSGFLERNPALGRAIEGNYFLRRLTADQQVREGEDRERAESVTPGTCAELSDPDAEVALRMLLHPADGRHRRRGHEIAMARLIGCKRMAHYLHILGLQVGGDRAVSAASLAALSEFGRAASSQAGNVRSALRQYTEAPAKEGEAQLAINRQVALIVDTLLSIDPSHETLDALALALPHARGEARRRIIELIGRAGRPAARHAGAVAMGLRRHESFSIQAQAAIALASIRPDEESAREISAVLGYGDEESKRAAILALERIGPPAAGAVPGLARLAADDLSPVVRQEAARVREALLAEGVEE